MSVKLTDKEISALAKKMADKDTKRLCEEKKVKAKTKMTEAKKVITALDALPEDVLNWLYNNYYRKDRLNAEKVAGMLAGVTSDSCNSCSAKDYEADVVLAAHDCTTMTALCKKLGI